jgi:1-deoxy-D-xylulose-5-phosphate synthase
LWPPAATAAGDEARVTVEENAIAGGAGSAVNPVLLAAGVQMPVLNCGIPDRFIEHDSRQDCLREVGLDSESLELKIVCWRLAAAASRHTGLPARNVVRGAALKS